MVRLLNAGFSRLLHYKQLYIAVILSFFLSASLTLSNIDSSNGIIAGETLNTMPVVGVLRQLYWACLSELSIPTAL